MHNLWDLLQTLALRDTEFPQRFMKIYVEVLGAFDG